MVNNWDVDFVLALGENTTTSNYDADVGKYILETKLKKSDSNLVYVNCLFFSQVGNCGPVICIDR